MADYNYDGTKWKSCCKSLPDLVIPPVAKLVYLKSNLPQYLNINGRAVTVPAHCIILNLSPAEADDFIEQGIMLEASEEDFATMNGLLL